MRVLFLAGGSPATVFALVPLATAARNGGHDVVVAATADMVEVITSAGLPAASVTPRAMRDFMLADRTGSPLSLPAEPGERMRFGGHGFGRLAAGSLPALRELGRAWRPDVVVGGALAFGAALLAAELKVPYVRHAWDMGEPAAMELGAADELAPELAELGLAELPAADLWIDICPPSVADPAAPSGLSTRFVPCALQRQLEPWMYTRGELRRVCVTAGSRVSKEYEFDHLDALVGKVRGPDVEVLVAAPEEAATALRERHPGVRAGWLPLDTVLPTCDLLLHAGGGQTALTAVRAGVPQMVVPNMPKLWGPNRRLADYGVARLPAAGEDGPGDVARVCREMLATPSYAWRAAELAAELAALPGPAEALPHLEKLARG
ncbi:nucleotide disphospho-sugar-binding domain-containing protein [Streptomyces sp. NPDC007904]|jgi:glycosyltransferase|uniref:glycosyltransferase n=1 Tax=Streptomyces sp. NPDC007904 TaxID=3364787 RepID=UPI0036E5247C